MSNTDLSATALQLDMQRTKNARATAAVVVASVHASGYLDGFDTSADLEIGYHHAGTTVAYANGEPRVIVRYVWETGTWSVSSYDPVTGDALTEEADVVEHSEDELTTTVLSHLERTDGLAREEQAAGDQTMAARVN